MPDFVREKSHVVSPEATRSEEGGVCSLSLSLGGLLCLQSLGKRGGQVSFGPCPRWSDGGGVRGGGGDLGEPLGSRDLGERGRDSLRYGDKL